MTDKTHASSAPVEPSTPVREPGEGANANAAQPLTTAAAGDAAPLEPSAEQDLWVGRTHWKYYAGRVVLWLVSVVLLAALLVWLSGRVTWLTTGSALLWTAVVGVVAGLIVIGGVLIKVLSSRYRLTTQRLFIERGLLSITIDHTELIRVDDVRISKTLLNRMLGVGTVTVLSTDVSDKQTALVGVERPEEVAEHIRKHMRALRRKSLYVENL